MNTRAIISELIAPLRNQIANLLARVVITAVDNATPTQRMQATAEDGGIEDVEHMQPYGLSAVPPAGSEGVILCVGGDRAVPIAVAVSEPGSRPTGQAPGEVAVYHRNGHMIHFRESGDIEISCKPGKRVYINDGSGGAALATLADVDAVRNALDGHTHDYISPAAPYVGPIVQTTNNPSVPAPIGTQNVWGK